MSRLPDLERALLNAAIALESDEPPVSAPTVADHRQARRRRRGGAPLLVAVLGLLSAGGAVAAVSGLLSEGEPVPATTRPFLMPAAPTAGFALADVRVADPDGGPPWGVGTYNAVAAGRPGLSRMNDEDAGAACVVVGRVQADKLGVVGRDGVFQNDGRFHRLAPASQASGGCGGIEKDGSFRSISFGPPIPASGYTGAAGTPIGGCRERVNLDGSTVSPQTRRRLKNVPECSESSLRQVIAGYAGPRMRTARLTAPGIKKTQKLQPSQNGAFLFVYRTDSGRPPRLQLTDRAGHTCDAFAHGDIRDPAVRATLCR